MRRRKSWSSIAMAMIVFATGMHADSEEARAAKMAREWRLAHEHQLLADYLAFLAIPNVSRDRANIRRNADFVLNLLTTRGVTSKLLEVADGNPVVYGELLTPGATHTYVFYAHYDGQPVDPKAWATPPFEPTIRTARLDRGGNVTVASSSSTPIDPEWRIYARGSSDDKAQVFAIISALDAIKAAGLKPRANLKFLFDGEEEIDSPSLPRILTANQALFKSDLFLIGDSPEHPSGRQTVTFGVRGMQKMEITVYGARSELHSGHYGNWAPNPAMMLAQLLASMKDADGRVLIEHFYDGVVPLSPADQQAIAEMPDNDVALMKDFGLARVEGGGKRLAELRALPSLNVRGMSSAHVGSAAANVIPASATADIDMRVVKGVTREVETQRLIEHIRKQGYFVTPTVPDDATRQRYPRVAQVLVDPAGYDAVRTPLDLPAVRGVLDAIKSARTPVILEPTMGGGLPLAPIEEILGVPTVIIPITNYDNNQHSDNENIRLQNLWNGIEIHAALMMMP